MGIVNKMKDRMIRGRLILYVRYANDRHGQQVFVLGTPFSCALSRTSVSIALVAYA